MLDGLHQSRLHVGLVGLGIGTLAAYGRPRDSYRFDEINPLVEKLARAEFTYLRDCRAQLQIVLGDARRLLELESPQRFDLLAICWRPLKPPSQGDGLS